MRIDRINHYRDERFTQRTLNQHGCFLADGKPYEIEILSGFEAVIRGREEACFRDIINEFRVFAPHITAFYKETGELVQMFSPLRRLTLELQNIQPSQFYINTEKVAAVSTFITSQDDIVIQVMKRGNCYIALDGHTRMYYAVMQGWTHIHAVEALGDEMTLGFAEEAIRRGIRSPYELQMLSHEDYESKWVRFCEEFIAQRT